jgi:hypothetical protein
METPYLVRFEVIRGYYGNISDQNQWSYFIDINVATPSGLSYARRLLQGRDFDERDTLRGHQEVIINESFARQRFSNRL